MIKIENLSKSYVKENKTIDNLILDIKNGEIFGFLGPNRSWKNNYYKDDYRYTGYRCWKYIYR